ncbi:T9SS type A sorting domain-containing protein [Snuella sedimenti]|uniref:T9SS type A sorting domain-containing protein n=1 Tax=Snuella sedimenti TaxID=2798802 RepID=A0A8J7ISK4_9FLAO|nr:T9SS type A sorting domain-containing protein [Snuella sedimenti]MBJ6367130.1 T9SS type A sorting domain-containing protein [Snuella sedimenti]
MKAITNLCVLLILFATVNNYSTNNSSQKGSLAYAFDNIQRVRIDFTMPNGYVRHLMIGFTPDNAATDGVDYGYDALNMDTYPDDLNWMIANERYVIQGVGNFDDTKKYPLGLFLTNSGDVKIDLDRLENFETPIDVFIYDALLSTYTKINENSYANTMASGEYLNRFYLAFKEDNDPGIFAKTLTTEEVSLKNTQIRYLNNTKELYVNTNNTFNIETITIFNIHGQKLSVSPRINKSTVKIPLNSIRTGHGIVNITTNHGSVAKQILIQ